MIPSRGREVCSPTRNRSAYREGLPRDESMPNYGCYGSAGALNVSRMDRRVAKLFGLEAIDLSDGRVVSLLNLHCV